MEWLREDTFRVGATEFVCCPIGAEMPASSPARFCLRKPRWGAEGYEQLLLRLEPKRIFEVGILAGGSTALMVELCGPDKHVAIDFARKPAPALEEFIAQRGLEDSLSTHYGVDQADAAKVAKIAAEQFGSDPLDLIVDDASHHLDRSRTTFDTLFPLLRPGGEYLLEDWAWAHGPINLWTDQPPLTTLVFEMLIAYAHNPGIVSGIEVGRGWVTARRGEQAVDPGSFELSDFVGERGRQLLAHA